MNVLKHWWKILAALLILYSLIAGLLIPLKSGVELITPDNAKTRDVLTIDIQGYNSHYQDAKEMRAWLKMDSIHLIKGQNFQIQSQIRMKVDFQIPDSLPNDANHTMMSLILDNEIDGYSLMPSAVAVTQLEGDTLPHIGNWETSISGIHTKEGLSFPYRNVLYETIRNLFYHVPLWFAMLIILFISMIYSVIYLILGNPANDYTALALTQVGILFGLLGLVTGAIWANWTWGEPWSGDVKQNMSAIAILIYLAFLVLRYAFDDYERQAKISSVYNIFAFATLIPLLFVIPRLYDSLHPGNGGNPGFGGDDLDNTMRMVFYPAIIGWTLMGFWLAQLSKRFMVLKEKWMDKDNNMYD